MTLLAAAGKLGIGAPSLPAAATTITPCATAWLIAIAICGSWPLEPKDMLITSAATGGTLPLVLGKPAA